MGPATSLTGTVELALVAGGKVSHLEGVRARELCPPLASCGTGWASLGSDRELALVIWAWESWLDDQLSYHPGPGPGL